jgi:hypothetical protein
MQQQIAFPSELAGEHKDWHRVFDGNRNKTWQVGPPSSMGNPQLPALVFRLFELFFHAKWRSLA